jgi:Tol biopolymer transport system component
MQEAAPNERDSNLWEQRVNSSGTKASGNPRRITNWPGLSVSDLSVSQDSKHLVFVNAGLQNDLYVAALEAKGALGTPRRLTNQGRNNVPSAWSADGNGLFFYSDRSGNWDIFRQSLQDKTAQDFVLAGGEQVEPRVSGDGLWVLYWDYVEKEGGASAPMRLLRVATSGGAPELVLEASRGAKVRCAHKSSQCTLSELDKVNGKLVFSAFDSMRGKKSELIRVPIDPGASPEWDLSPDDSSVGIVGLGEHGDVIRQVELKNGEGRSIPVGHSERLSGISWSSDGTGWFVTSSSVRGAGIFYVGLNGKVSRRLTSKANLGTPLASPDGKNLAFTISTYNSNAWVIENF